MRKILLIVFMFALSVATQAQNIIRFEYFFDTDPGFGAGSILNVTPSTSINDLNIPVSTSSLSTGFHKLYLRAQNVNNEWTHTHVRSFYIVPLTASLVNITQIEYFIDTDPGIGSATQVSFTAATTITNLAIDISAVPLTPGFHKLYVRSKSSDGQWTHTHLRSFYVVPFVAAANITQIEYFIDTDPGIGNATQVSFTAAATITNLAIDISAVPLTSGFHKLYVRSKSSDGQWTHTHLRSFYITNVAANDNLVKFEYYFDTDPGFDNGNAVAITPAAPSVTNKDILADATGLSIGTHTINIRAKDSGGEWTHVSTGTFSVTVSLVPTITSFTPTSGIASTTVTITGTNFTGATVVSFGGTPAASFTVVSATSITATTGAGATGKISVTTPNGTATSSNDYTFTQLDLISISTQPTSVAVCEGSNATFTLAASGTTNLTYQWQKFNGTIFTDLVNGSGYTGVTSATLTINTTGNVGAGNYRCKVSGDNSLDKLSNAVTLTVNSLPAAPGVTGASSCAVASLTLNATGANDGQYRWYTTATGGTAIVGQVNSIYLTPVITNTTSYYVSINNGTCESERTTITASIYTAPPKPSLSASEPITAGVIQLCQQAITLTAPAGYTYTWSTGQTTPSITITQPGNFSVVVKDPNGCNSVASDVIQVVLNNTCTNNPPVINTTSLLTTIGGFVSIDLTSYISDPDNNLDPSSIQVVSNKTQQGGKTTLTGFNLYIDYSGINFSGSDQVTIRVCDLLNSCIEQELAIDVVGDIIIYNGVSPNGDGKNDTWIIEYIDLFQDTQKNQVSIYNRWGDVVWETSNYNNVSAVFTGLNKNGTELPTGSYFYKIKFNDRKGSLPTIVTGYISLKR